MSILVHIFAALIGLDDLINVALTKNILVLASFKIIGSINEQNVIGIAVALPLENKDTHRNTCAKEEIGRETDHGIQHIQLLDKVFTDHFFRCTTEQNAMRQQHNSSSVLVHVMYHVLHKSKVSLALRGKLAVFVEPGIFHEAQIARPLCRIRRIGNLNTELHVTEVVMLQSVTVVDIEIAVRNATENHVHSGKVVGGGSKLLTIVVTHICIVFEAQQKRARATSGIGCVLDIR